MLVEIRDAIINKIIDDINQYVSISESEIDADRVISLSEFTERGIRREYSGDRSSKVYVSYVGSVVENDMAVREFGICVIGRNDEDYRNQGNDYDGILDLTDAVYAVIHCNTIAGLTWRVTSDEQLQYNPNANNTGVRARIIRIKSAPQEIQSLINVDQLDNFDTLNVDSTETDDGANIVTSVDYIEQPEEETV